MLTRVPCPRYLAVPGIAFPPSIVVARNVRDDAACPDWPPATQAAGEEQHETPMQFLGRIAGLLVTH
jgi:hypothetical protein